MRTSTWRWAALLGLLAGGLPLVACNEGRRPVTATIGPEGGTLTGPAGASLVVPAGALTAPTELTLAIDATGAPKLEVPGLSPVFAVTPHGTSFQTAAILALPFDAQALPAGSSPRVLKAEPGGRWKVLPFGLTEGSVRSLPVEDLSWFVVVACRPDDPCSTQQIKLEYLDSPGGLALEVQPDRFGVPSLTALPITLPTNLPMRATYTGPPASADWDILTGSTLSPLRQPLDTYLPEGATRYVVDFTISVDPASVPGATGPQGTDFTVYADLFGGTLRFFCPGALVCTVPWDIWAGIRFKVRYGGPTPAIGGQPSDVTVVEGQPASFSVTATGPALTYQWRETCGGASRPLANGSGSTLSLPAVPLADDGCLLSVRVCATGGRPPVTACADSAAATLHVTPLLSAPVFTVQPVSLTVAAGQDATFTATAAGHPAPRVEWFLLVDPNGTGNLVPVPAGCPATTGTGASTSASCTFTALRPGSNGQQVMARATNGSGTVGSTVVTLTVTTTPATILAGLANQTVPEGSQASFTVVAGGNPAPSYAWTLGGAPIPGCGNTPTCSFTAGYGDSGKAVEVTVTNAAGSARSSAALTVTIGDLAPTITRQPGPQSVVAPAVATFTAAAAGVPAPTLQWQLSTDGAATWNDLALAAGPSYSTGPTQVSQSGWLLRLKATNQVRVQPDAGAVLREAFSNPATLTVVPFIPAGALLASAIAAGDNVSYAVAPDGGLWAWGATVDAETGQFDPDTSLRPSATHPVRVRLDADAGVPLAGVVAVATARGLGYGSAYALHADGTVSAWGTNGSGQLGDRTTTDRVAPVKVLDGASPVTNACAIAAANQVLIVVRSDDPGGSCAPGAARSAWVAGRLTGSSWGGTPATNTGVGEVLTPVPGLPAGVPVVAVAGRGAMNSGGAVVFLLQDGRRFAVGQSSNNELGGGVSVPWLSSVTDVTGFWSGAAEVALGGAGFSLARLVDGTVAAVGRNNEGELGDPDAGTILPRTILGAVPGLAAVSAVAAGDRTALALQRSELWLWGYAWDFVSGIPSPFNALSPVRVGTDLGFTAISVGTTHALALGPGGVVYAFGSASGGALGNGQTTGHVYLPTAVTH